MKRYNMVIVYEDGTSRTTSAQSDNKTNAINKALESDRDTEMIINITIVEHIRKDI